MTLHRLTGSSHSTAQTKHTNPKTGQPVFKNTHQLLFAQIRHQTSRENEPQLHTHMLMPNMTLDHEGTLRTLATCRRQDGIEVHGTAERIYTHQKYFTALYQSHLADQVEKMGYTVHAVGQGQFEIDGVPQALLDAKSTRRQQIKDHAEAQGFDSQPALEVAAKDTRKPKSQVPTATLRQRWQAVTEKHNFDGIAFVAQSYQRLWVKPRVPTLPTIDPRARDALDRSLRHHSQFSSTLSYEKLISSAVNDLVTGEPISALAVKRALDNAIKQGDVIPLQANHALLTTQALINSEKALLDYTHVQIPRHAHSTSRPLKKRKSSSALGLNNEQQQTLQSLLTSRQLVNVVNVRGDSMPLAQSLVSMGYTSGYRVQVITPDKRHKIQTHQTMQQSSSPRSVIAWLRQQWRGDYVHTIGHYVHTDAQKMSTDKTLLVVEAAQRLRLEDTHALLAKAEANQSPVIFLHHREAQRGYKAGNPVATLQQGQALTVDWTSTHTHPATVKWHEYNNDERLVKIVDAYAKLSPQQRATTQILATSPVAVKHLNQAVREQLQQQDEVKGKGKGKGGRVLIIDTHNPVWLTDAQRESAGCYQKGWQLIEWQDKQKRSYTITGVDRRHNNLILRDNDSHHPTSTVNVALDRITAQQRRWQISQPGRLELSAGDQLRVNGDHYPAQLKQHQQLRIEKIGHFLVKATDTAGKTHRLTRDELHHAPLSYNYAKTLNQADHQTADTWVYSQAYAVSKNLLHDLLTPHTQNVTFFTDDGAKLAAKLQQSRLQPSTMQRVLQAARHKHTETLISPRTTAALIHDVHVALDTLVQQSLPPDRITQAVQFALDKIGERQAGFQHQTVVKEAISYALDIQGRALTQTTIEDHLADCAKQEALLSADYSDGTRWTTAAALAMEQRILTRLQQGKNTVTPLVSQSQAENYCRQQSQLTQGQQQAITLIATTRDQHIAIQGFAGTGKSTMLASGIELIQNVQVLLPQASRPRFVGLAPTHAAVKELQAKDVDAQTLQSLLHNPIEQQSTPHLAQSDQPASNVVAPSSAMQTTAKDDPERPTVFLLDEASMTSNQHWDQFTRWIAGQPANKVRVVYLGDSRQLTAIDAGQPFALAVAKKIIDSVEMKDIIRQKTQPLLKAAHAIIDRQPEQTMEALKQQSPSKAYYPQPTQTGQGGQAHCHVISTYQATTGDPKTDREEAEKRLNAAVAQDYLTRPLQARANTLIIAYTNKERDGITQLIRKGLQREGRLDTQDYRVTRLRALNLERAVMATMTPYETGLVLTITPRDYYHITDVNRLNGIVTLKHANTGETTYFFPSHHDHRFTELWSSSQPELAKGDTIMLKRTDKPRRWEGNQTYTVQAIDHRSMTLRHNDRPDDKPLTLSRNQLQDAHWDYAYTRTADLAQGTTVDNVITAIRSNAQISNIRRAYIDITRAAHHVKVFTDSADKTVLAWYNHPSDKASAITTLENDRITPDVARTRAQHTEKQAPDSVMHDRSSDQNAPPAPSHHQHQPSHPSVKDNDYEKGERSL